MKRRKSGHHPLCYPDTLVNPDTCLGLNLTYLCGLTPVKLKILIIDGSNGRRRLFNFNLGLALLRILVSLFLIQIDSKTRRTATRVQRGLGRA